MSQRGSNARNTGGVPGEPGTQFRIGPGPLAELIIKPVVIQPRGPYVLDERPLIRPGVPFRISTTEGVVQQLGSVHPVGVCRGSSRPPPVPEARQVDVSRRRDVTRAAVVDQVDPAQMSIVGPEQPQRPDVTRRVVVGQDGRPHTARVDDEER